MKNNVGDTDKTIRLGLAVIIIFLYLTKMIPGVVGLILMAIALIFAVTSLIGFCPLYTLLKISTSKVK
ncbi:MAG: DUF2892 domain-containing protein [Desulfobacteraceae bacterium]|nr:MAG: DUF2892 domain-containing protein [Desulfobacteraceae bacterium]